MKWFMSIVFISIILSGCSSSSSSSNNDADLMNDNAQIINIANRTTFSDLSKDDKAFIDEFLNKYYKTRDQFESYSEKEKQIILEAVEKIEKMKKK